MSAPRIPDNLQLECAMIAQGCGTFEDVWPRLYAVALRHAAQLVYHISTEDGYVSPMGVHDWLKRMADEVSA